MPEAARLNDTGKCRADAHGCPACPHSVQGPIIIGSEDVFINGRPAARVGDGGIHGVCCGPNTFEIKMGSSSVFINGKKAARKGDMTKHCGGVGTIDTGSGDVNAGG